eukprot:7802060-Alexandrium_andersonii.AAC.1
MAVAVALRKALPPVLLVVDNMTVARGLKDLEAKHEAMGAPDWDLWELIHEVWVSWGCAGIAA